MISRSDPAYSSMIWRTSSWARAHLFLAVCRVLSYPIYRYETKEAVEIDHRYADSEYLVVHYDGRGWRALCATLSATPALGKESPSVPCGGRGRY